MIAYGITTVQLTCGVSTIKGLTLAPNGNVIDQIIVGLTGAGALFAAGFSSADNGSLVAAGALIQTGAMPLSLGVGPVYFTTTGNTVVVSILKKLSAGYSGQQALTP